MNKDKLKLVIEENSGFKTIKIVDENDECQGESIHFDGSFFWYKAFCKDGYFVGKVVDYNTLGKVEAISFYSFEKLGKNISEEEHRKELFKLRMGIIECPQLSIYLKDFGYEHGY
jgi:hypothetical protein